MEGEEGGGGEGGEGGYNWGDEVIKEMVLKRESSDQMGYKPNERVAEDDVSQVLLLVLKTRR